MERKRDKGEAIIKDGISTKGASLESKDKMMQQTVELGKLVLNHIKGSRTWFAGPEQRPSVVVWILAKFSSQAEATKCLSLVLSFF
jgi:hypothetical protein